MSTTLGPESMNKGKAFSSAENTFHYSKQQLLDLFQDSYLIPDHMIELPVVVKDILKPWALLAANVQEEELAKIPVVQKKEPGFKYASTGRGRGTSRGGGKSFHREGHGTWEQKDWGKRRTDRSDNSADQLSPEDLRRPKDDLMWLYKDPSQQVQGPFDDVNMTKWYDDGYFPDDLLVKRVFQSEFVELRDLPKDSHGNPFSTPDPKPPGFGGVAPKKTTAPPKQGEKESVDDGEAMEHIMQDIMKSYGKNPQDTTAPAPAPQPTRAIQPTVQPVPQPQPQIPVPQPQQPVSTPTLTPTSTAPAPFRQGPNPQQFVYPQMMGRPIVPPSVPLQRKEGVFVMDEYGIPRDLSGNVAAVPVPVQTPVPAPGPQRAWTGQAPTPMMYHPSQMGGYPSPNPWMMMQMMNQQGFQQPQVQPQPVPQQPVSTPVVAPVQPQPEPVKPQVPETPVAPLTESSSSESDGFQTQTKDRKKKEKKAPQSPKSAQKPETEELKPKATAPKPKETLKPPQPPKQEGHFKDIQQQQEKLEAVAKKEKEVQQQQQQAAVKQAKASWAKVEKPAKSLNEIIQEQSQEAPQPKKVVEAPKPALSANGKMAWNVKKVAEPAPVANKDEFPSLKK